MGINLVPRFVCNNFCLKRKSDKRKIANYIKRTESEMLKLKELSYDQ